MKRYAHALIWALAVGLTPQTQAQAQVQAQDSGPSLASLERLLVVTRAESLIDGMHGHLEAVMKQAFVQAAGGKATPEQQRAFDKMLPRMAALMREEFTWAQVKPPTLQVYRETLTQAEVDGLVAFYESPVGQSFVAKQPLLAQKSALVGLRHMERIMPKVLELVQQAAQEAPQVAK